MVDRRLRFAPSLAIALLELISGPGCYRPMAPITTPSDRYAWVERLGVVCYDKPVATCPVLSDERAIIALAIERSPEIAALEGEARWLEASAEASYAPSPQLRMNNLRLDEVVANQPRFELGLRVPFAKPGTLDAKADVLRQEAMVARARAEEEARKLTLDVRVALARHFGWKALVVLAADQRVRADAEVKRLEAGAAKSQVAEIDVARAQIAALEAEGAAARAEAEAARWLSVVTAAIGSCAIGDQDIETWGKEIEIQGTVSRMDFVQQALSQRPSLKLAAARAGMATAQSWDAKAEAWPWLAWAELGYELTSPAAADTWTFGLAIDLPLWAWNGAHEEAAAIAERAAVESAKREAAMILAEVDAALAESASRASEVAALEQVRSRGVWAKLGMLENAAREGLADPADVFRLRREQADLDRRWIEALIARQEAYARLLAAIAR